VPFIRSLRGGPHCIRQPCRRGGRRKAHRIDLRSVIFLDAVLLLQSSISIALTRMCTDRASEHDCLPSRFTIRHEPCTQLGTQTTSYRPTRTVGTRGSSTGLATQTTRHVWAISSMERGLPDDLHAEVVHSDRACASFWQISSLLIRTAHSASVRWNITSTRERGTAPARTRHPQPPSSSPMRKAQ